MLCATSFNLNVLLVFLFYFIFPTYFKSLNFSHSRAPFVVVFNRKVLYMGAATVTTANNENRWGLKLLLRVWAIKIFVVCVCDGSKIRYMKKLRLENRKLSKYHVLKPQRLVTKTLTKKI